jgi:signal transduction histidine kinase
MRAFDWQSSELGEPERWPVNLRVALQICLASRFPMNVWWGSSLTLFYNDACISLLGSQKHPAVLGKSGREAWSEIWATIGPMIETAMATGAASWSQDIPLFVERQVAKQEVDVTFSFSPIFDGDGQVGGLFCACTEMPADRIGRHAAESNRVKDEFIAMLGHELRNPLSPIVTAVQLLRMRGQQSRELAVIERQTNHLVRLVDDLLDISRITRGKIELRKQRLELASVVARGVEMASPLFEQRRQRLEVDVATEGLGVEGDQERLAQIVSNLLTNASKYSEPHTSIRIRASRKGSAIELCVKDEGIGIPAGMLDRVFDMFVQQPQASDRSKGGLGLGLAIVRSLVTLHGGHVRATSSGVGQGSEFIVELPAADRGARPAPPTQHAADNVPITSPSRGESRRILVVDDNDDAVDTLAILLAQLGHEVATARDGPSAIETARRFRPEVCLLDIGLPVMDGYELAHHLRKLDISSRDLRLIAVTGYGTEADRRRSAEAGFSAHVVKPVNFDELVRIVTN